MIMLVIYPCMHAGPVSIHTGIALGAFKSLHCAGIKVHILPQHNNLKAHFEAYQNILVVLNEWNLHGQRFKKPS